MNFRSSEPLNIGTVGANTVAFSLDGAQFKNQKCWENTDREEMGMDGSPIK